MTEAENLRSAVGRLRSILAEQEALGERLAVLAAQRKQLEETELPEIFSSMEIRQFVMEDGSVLKSGVVARGSLPKDARRERAVAWMVANGLENVIESTLEASWPRGQREAALEALDAINAPNARVDDSVHWKTYCKVIQEKIKEGVEVPLDVLGVTLVSGVRFTTLRPRPEQETA
jgi:hypothetical protein